MESCHCQLFPDLHNETFFYPGSRQSLLFALHRTWEATRLQCYVCCVAIASMCQASWEPESWQILNKTSGRQGAWWQMCWHSSANLAAETLQVVTKSHSHFLTLVPGGHWSKRVGHPNPIPAKMSQFPRTSSFTCLDGETKFFCKNVVLSL